MTATLLGGLANDIAVDFGTANTLVHARGRGLVVNEPSVVAVTRRNSKTAILAVGGEAARMIGRTPDSIQTIRPVRAGAIADFNVARELMRRFIGRATRGRRFPRPRAIVCVPSGATPVERRAIRQATAAAGARRVFLIDEALAAGVGAGLPVTESTGSMLVDIGGGTTEVAVLALGGVVQSRSVPVGGFAMDEAIAATLRREHGLLIGQPTSEAIKRTIGAAVAARAAPKTIEVRGRDQVSGVPRVAAIDETEVSDSLADALGSIIDAILRALETMPPEFAADIADRGIVPTGGGALLNRLDLLLRRAVGLPVVLAEEPLTCAVRGAAFVLANEARFPTILHDQA